MEQKYTIYIPFTVPTEDRHNPVHEGLLKKEVHERVGQMFTRDKAELTIDYKYGEDIYTTVTTKADVSFVEAYDLDKQFNVTCKVYFDDVTFFGDLADVEVMAQEYGFEVLCNDGSD